MYDSQLVFSVSGGAGGAIVPPGRPHGACSIGAEMDGRSARSSCFSRRSMRSSMPRQCALVDLVRNHVLAHIGERIAMSEFLLVTGVSESRLRRAIHAETGVPLVQFMTDIRLDHAHALLSTDREARTIAQLASALGFGSAPVFSRAYRRRFGEAMSETRRRAVMSGEGVGVCR